MDIATLLGLLSGLGIIAFAIGPEQLGIFIDVTSFLIVVVGTIAAIMVNYPLKDLGVMIAVGMKTLFYKTNAPEDVIPSMVEYAGTARRDGILALQSVMGQLDNDFMKLGLQLAIDGAEPQSIMKILETEIEYVKGRHKDGIDMFMALATLAPAFGMIGTLVGLVLMLQKLDDPSSIGPAMAIALITTFYGALMANLFFMPMAGKLKKRDTDEIMVMELVLEGIISIASGDNPRLIEQKLNAFLLPKLRKSSFD